MNVPHNQERAPQRRDSVELSMSVFETKLEDYMVRLGCGQTKIRFKNNVTALVRRKQRTKAKEGFDIVPATGPLET